MKKFFLFIFITALSIGTLSANNNQSEKALLGQWKFESPAAPWGYNNGTIVIAKTEGKLAGYVKFSDGYKIDLKNVNFTDGILKSRITVDYENVEIKATIDGKIMKGTASSSEGDLPFTATKAE